MSLVPTSEQRRVLDLARTYSRLAVHAFAGSGKTATLRLLAEADSRSSLYLAFNKATAQDAAASFPDNVRCCTIHSLAHRALRSRYASDKLSNRLTAAKLAAYLAPRPKQYDLGRGTVKLSPIERAALILDTIRTFSHSDDPEIEIRHVSLTGARYRGGDVERTAIAEFVALAASRLWSAMCEPRSKIPLGHDGYLKLWALGGPDLKTRVIYLDEAQDTNPVVVGLLRRQDARLVMVGDPHQQIYAWRGATDAMAALGGTRTHLTGSFRFGPDIARAASDVLRTLGETRSIIGNPTIASRIAATGAVRAVLARTNATVIDELVKAQGKRVRVHILGGKHDLLKLMGDVRKLMARRLVEDGELAGFSDWPTVERWSRTERGRNLRSFVNLVRDYGIERLIAAVEASEAEETVADLVVGTAHKAKGRQWSSVRLCGDFTPKRDERTDPGEIRLFYVALTRSQTVLVADPEVLTLFGVETKRDRSGA